MSGCQKVIDVLNGTAVTGYRDVVQLKFGTLAETELQRVVVGRGPVRTLAQS
jgi:ribosomal protein S28E/S33